MKIEQDYQIRPEKDKRCVELILYTILFIIIGTILIRIFIFFFWLIINKKYSL